MAVISSNEILKDFKVIDRITLVFIVVHLICVVNYNSLNLLELVSNLRNYMGTWQKDYSMHRSAR